VEAKPESADVASGSAPLVIMRHTPLSELPELLTVEEAAMWLHVSRGTLYEAITANEIAHLRIGRLVRISRQRLLLMRGSHGASH
jgi:excisionase family DNA binding protein